MVTNLPVSTVGGGGAEPVGDVAASLIVSDLRSSLAGPFDLSVPPGCVVSIAGASGSGKSLFLRMIADLDPNEGRVSLGDRSRADLDAPCWRRIAPYVAAEPGWWREDVAGHFAAEHVAAARALALRLGVGHAEFRGSVGRLSTGERQRLALVRALVLDSPVLLLDEPTGPLDPASVARVEDVLLERARVGVIVIMASHDPLQGVRLAATRYRMVTRRLELEA